MPVLLIVALLFAAGIVFAYKRSSVVCARKLAISAVSEVETLRSGLLAQGDQTRQKVAEAVRQMENSVHTERLRLIPVENIRSYASGLRLQALRDAGKNSILDLQGWSPQQLAGIRGIGPKSAGSIARSVEMLTQKAKSVPIKLPCFPLLKERDRALFQAIYCDHAYQSGMPQQKRDLESLYADVYEKLTAVRQDSTFFAWIFSLGHSGRMIRARETAENLAQELDGKPEVLVLTQQLTAFLAESRGLAAGKLLLRYFKRLTPRVLGSTTGCYRSLSVRPTLERIQQTPVKSEHMRLRGPARCLRILDESQRFLSCRRARLLEPRRYLKKMSTSRCPSYIALLLWMA